MTVHATLPAGTVTNVGDWAIDTSTGTPILVYKECSVIESEQAAFVLSLINGTAPPAPQLHGSVGRKTFPWVEGRSIPDWVRDIASGPQGCENTYIIAELDAGKQSQGWPQFIAAYIDMRLNRYICGNTAENVSDHVLRYLPFDHSEVESQHAE